MSPIQQEIAEIAYEAAHDGRSMTMEELADELNSRGFNVKNDRGLYRRVSTTYDRAEDEGNDGVASNIATVFTDDDGEYLWE